MTSPNCATERSISQPPTDPATQGAATARLLPRIADVAAADWDALIPPGAHPFLTHRFLHALEASGCAAAETGWAPRHVWVEDENGVPLAAAPLYAKMHSQGEYVFDHGWADALERSGLPYYPKLQCSVPFTPATGPRLLSHSLDGRMAALATMVQAVDQLDCSSVHLTFLTEADRAACDDAGLLHRTDRQFHFVNRGYADFDAFLGSLASRKRKNIRKERARAQDGVTIRRLTGDDLEPHHWDAFYRCYLDTGSRKWGRPYLNREFFARLHETMADDVLLVMAFMDDQPVAAALNFIGSDALYGRYWGALVHKPFLHFELSYYQAIDAALERGLPRVEAGAQGKHKLARGYKPVATHSAHYIAHPGLHEAIGNYLERERAAVDWDVKALERHVPFRKGGHASRD
ncbi:GNAT family N-acetyltransferase [uncultured Algimonas sp.]|uniref:GNAT family N-acetyltransferase n=1 Tax=uncultured Algimonas sp. TaxID=1547920 RepID=UPI0026338A7D|nr:GNAT family N-acetyltransferase [uncultured Algimonas sp.]